MINSITNDSRTRDKLPKMKMICYYAITARNVLDSRLCQMSAYQSFKIV